jgi:hypothetical protein
MELSRQISSNKQFGDVLADTNLANNPTFFFFFFNRKEKKEFFLGNQKRNRGAYLFWC